MLYEGSAEFEAQLLVRIQSGQAPDIAMIPQPGLLESIVTDNPGLVVPAPEAAVANFEEFYNQDVGAYGTVDDVLYGLPNSSNAEVVRVVLAQGFRRGRLRGSRPRGTRWSPCPTRSSRTTSTTRPSSPGAPASAPVTPPAGPLPTGWRTSCSACTAPRSTTSGSTTRSPSTTRRSPTCSKRSAGSSRTPTTSTAASAASARSRRPSSSTGACPSSTATATCTARRGSTPRRSRRAPPPPRTATSGRSTCPS